MVYYNFTVPAPSSVTVTSNQFGSNPIWSIGSDVYLICTVRLSPAVDVPVTVNTVWTGPDGIVFHSDPEAVMENHNVYTSTVTISSFGREQSGNYTCTASVNSSTPFLDDSNSTSHTTEVTVGKHKSNNLNFSYSRNEGREMHSNNDKQGSLLHSPSAAPNLAIFHHVHSYLHTYSVNRATIGQILSA